MNKTWGGPTVLFVCSLRPTAAALVVVAAAVVVQSRGDFTQMCQQIVKTLGCHSWTSSVGHINTRLSSSRTCRYSGAICQIGKASKGAAHCAYDMLSVVAETVGFIHAGTTRLYVCQRREWNAANKNRWSIDHDHLHNRFIQQTASLLRHTVQQCVSDYGCYISMNRHVWRLMCVV